MTNGKTQTGATAKHEGERQLAVITGASSGIGRALALLCAEAGYDCVIAADDASIDAVGGELLRKGVAVDVVLCDLATTEGNDSVIDAVRGRRVELLLANAGHGLGHAFLDQTFREVRHVIDTNVTGTLYLIHSLARRMRQAGRGKILITGSIAGYMPGSFQAVYNGSKAMIDSFSYALGNELKDTGVTVTCLMPGATETEFFARAGLLDTKVGQSKKGDPADVAKQGFDAMMRGDHEVITGFTNKLRAMMSKIAPGELAAELHRSMAEPGSGAR